MYKNFQMRMFFKDKIGNEQSYLVSPQTGQISVNSVFLALSTKLLSLFFLLQKERDLRVVEIGLIFMIGVRRCLLSWGLVIKMKQPENFELLFDYFEWMLVLDPLFLSMECF